MPLVVAAVLFALGNRTPALLAFSPFHEPVEVPLYLIGLGMLGLGFILGVFTTWVAMHGLRVEKRRQRKTIKELEKQLDQARENEVKAAPPVLPVTPEGG